MESYKIKRCECCKRVISKVHFSRKFCVSCGLYIRDLRYKVSYYQRKSIRLTKEICGQKSKAERLRK